MRKKGFSLIELLVVALIFASIFVAILGILNVGKRSWRLGTTQAEIQQEARRAMSMITKELRGATDLVVNTDTIQFTLKNQTIKYALSGSDLKKTVSTVPPDEFNATVPPTVFHDFESIQFTLLGSDIVYIVLSTKQTSMFTGDLQFNLNAHIKLRN